MAAATTQTTGLKAFFSSVRLSGDAPEVSHPRPMLSSNLETIVEDVSTEERFMSSMAAVLYNIKPGDDRFDKQSIQDIIADIDLLVEAQLNEILHAPAFQQAEAAWTSIADLVEETNFNANISLGLLDVTKEEAHEDLELNAADVAGSEIFKKVYIQEYDQFGGTPYGGIIGLYDFANTKHDLLWLRTMGKIAEAAHSPFVAAASPKLFQCKTMAEVSQLRDIAGLFNTPAYDAWRKFRDSDAAVYVGLTMPRYLARVPYNLTTNPADGMNFTEKSPGDDDSRFLWGNTSMLFARCLVKSFENSGWCQSIRGVKNGGQLTGLPAHAYNLRGEDEFKGPMEISVPDFRELELANVGIIPLVQKKGTSEAVFFSTQSVKLSKRFKDPKDSENSQLVTNLAYTYSVSRLAHYVKGIMRNNVGSTADAEYIKSEISNWISEYVTTVTNPDDLTLQYYPFKAFTCEVAQVPGKSGWYHCNLAILPHIQMEGLDVDIRIDARLAAGS